MSVDEIVGIVEENGFDVTLTGGDPLFQAEAILPLARELHGKGYGIWCYTGYTYEAVARDASISRLLEYCDVLVDGPFVIAERDVHLTFRGSANQRLIDLHASTPGNIRLWEPDTVAW